MKDPDECATKAHQVAGSTTHQAKEEMMTIDVVVRVRPLSTVENADPTVKNVVQCLKNCIVVSGAPMKEPSRYFGARHAKPRPKQFNVDKVFHQHSTQIEVYEACRHVVEGAFEGVNGSILAYGATGSGKTHTMLGGSMSAGGVIYQAVQDILEGKRQLEENSKSVSLRCSFVEVYNEKVFDLLVPAGAQGKRVELKVQDFAQYERSTTSYNTVGKHHNINPESLIVRGLTYLTPSTVEDFTKCVERGHVNRSVACTGANAHSSRSHAIFTVEIEVKDTINASCGTVGRIRFCDLAGSERAAGTNNSGARLREGANINCSLLALGAVVQELACQSESQEKSRYIPYRGSKLTRLLRDSLAGNCRTLMLFCISPNSMNYEETMNTMHFAMQAKKVQVAAKRHEFRVDSKAVAESQEALIEELRMELAAAREEIVGLRGARLNTPLGFPPVSHGPLQGTAEPAGAQMSLQDQPVPQPLPLSARKSEAISALALSVRQPSTSRQQLVLGCSPRQSTRISVRMSQLADMSETFKELQSKIKDLSAEKETLYRGMREAEETHNDLELRLRQQKWKLVRFLSTKKVSTQRGESDEDVVSVGVAGLRNTIEKMEEELAAHGGQIECLLSKMNATDRALASARQELLREKQHPLLELLLDNVKLRQDCTEAECLAAHYHQQYRSVMNREEEYMQALVMCVSAIRDMLTYVPPTAAITNEAQLALMFANLTPLATSDIIPVFEQSLKTGTMPPIPRVNTHLSLSSARSMEACLQQLVQRNRLKENAVARSAQHKRAVGTTSKTVGTALIAASGRCPKSAARVMTAPPKPFARSQTALNASLKTKPRNATGAMSASVTNRKRSVPHHSKEVPPKGAKLHLGNGTKTGTSSATQRVRKGNASPCPKPIPYMRSQTQSALAQKKMSRGASRSPPPREKGRMSTRASQGRLSVRRNDKESREPSSVRQVKNSDLEARFQSLLTEMRQWNHDKPTIAKRSNCTSESTGITNHTE
ncbi:Microtubule binding Kinesin motor domain [Trypanosoma vivax]|nr:putative kinesin [Trypanosoma vivax]KAH8619229.1 Microtubule binding Kinesin motor domain [Trypanosoma vivax]